MNITKSCNSINNLKQPPLDDQADGEHDGEHDGENDDESSLEGDMLAGADGSGQAESDQQRVQSLEQEPTPIQTDEDQNNLNGFHCPDGPFDAYMNNNFLPFNIDDFPYIPDGTEPLMECRDHMLPLYPSANLDALVGTTNSLDFSGAGTSMQNRHLDNTMNGAVARATSYDNNFALPLDEMVSTQNNAQLQEDAFTPGMEDLSPINNFPASGSDIFNGESTAQREVLLAVVDRLIRVASVM